MKFTVFYLGKYSSDYFVSLMNKHFELRNQFSVEVLNFSWMNERLPKGDEALKTYLKGFMEKCRASGTRSFLFPNITLHEAIRALDDEGFDIIDPIDLLLKDLENRNCTEMFLLGTRHTMNKESFVARKLAKTGVRLMFPTKEMIKALDEIRLQVYEKGPNALLKERLNGIISSLDAGVPKALICTELSALMPEGEDVIDPLKLMCVEAQRRIGG